MKRRLFAILLVLGLTTLAVTMGAAPASSSELSNDLVVVIDPTTRSVVLGENLDLSIAVTNTGGAATPPLIIHIDITDPGQATSVDPEDWTPTLSQTIGEVASGETVVVNWTIQPISAGTFATYAVALSPGVAIIAASNVLQVRVRDQRSLNPGGILPVAIATPSLISLLLLAQTRLARRTRQG